MSLMSILHGGVLFLVALACLAVMANGNSERPEVKPWTDFHMVQNFHELSALDIDGNHVEFKDHFKGKAVLVVNVASHCGYTAKNYQDFKTLHEEFGNRLAIVAFPCNQFGNQEADGNSIIKAFAESQGFTGKTAFLMDKLSVNGAGTQHPVYKFLKEASRDPSPLGWNFVKFLVRPDGKVHGRYDTKVNPEDLIPEIRKILRTDEL